jgi:hypothetical protein
MRIPLAIVLYADRRLSIVPITVTSLIRGKIKSMNPTLRFSHVRYELCLSDDWLDGLGQALGQQYIGWTSRADEKSGEESRETTPDALPETAACFLARWVHAFQ